MKIKTLFLFEYFMEGSFFFELPGDYSHLNGVQIDGSDSDHATDSNKGELYSLVFDEDGDIKVEELSEPSKDWTFFVKCGIY